MDPECVQSRNERRPAGLFRPPIDSQINDGASFLRALSGDGGATPYAITDVYGLQGVGTYNSDALSPIAPLLGSNFVLANNIDATITKLGRLDCGERLQAYRPIIPTVRQASRACSTVQGHIIDGLYYQQTSFDVGLFGYSDGTITRLVSPT